MRSIEIRLRDILEACEMVRGFIEEVESLEYFEASPLYQSAVIYQLIIIGEAVVHIDDEFKSRHRQIPWDNLKRFRNFAAHQYFGIDWIEVWNMCERILSDIEQRVAEVLSKEFPDF